jgi:hypothetical protein
MELTANIVAPLEQPLFEVWNQIGYDVYEIYNGKSPDPEEVIELCIDANRLSTFISGEEGVAAEQLVRALIDKHGYHNVLSFLAKQFPMS